LLRFSLFHQISFFYESDVEWRQIKQIYRFTPPEAVQISNVFRKNNLYNKNCIRDSDKVWST
jgi:hypothetical protein